MKIYITLVGLDGYLPQYCTFFDTYEKAVEYLIGKIRRIKGRGFCLSRRSILWDGTEDTELAEKLQGELEKELRKELREEGFFYLKDSHHRNKYVKIIEHDLDYLQIYIRKSNRQKRNNKKREED